jgi:hypothetical protein
MPKPTSTARLALLVLLAALLGAGFLGLSYRTAIAPALPTPTPQPTATPTPTPWAALPAETCRYSPAAAQILAATSAEQWIGWVARLSGAEPVTVGGEETRILTRYSSEMFSGNPNARAFEYVREQVLGWYPPEQLTAQDYTVSAPEEQTLTWQNLVLTLPGTTRPEKIVILSAHLDSTSDQPETLAPGAEDNASGAAALLEAARIFRHFRFERTVQIIWFTGEEQGLLGSRAFVAALEDPSRVVGVINLDMFGYDSTGDRCFELHVGHLPASDAVGQCFSGAIEEYGLDLPRHDYLTGGEAISRSDHGSFWEAGIGAVEVLQNMFDNQQPGGCPDGDRSPYYHTTQDTVDRINPETGIEIVRATLAATAALAGIVE